MRRKAETVSQLLRRWIKTNWTMLLNAGSLVGTTAVTGIFGFAYWWIAARLFPPHAVGLASAAVSAMTLLGTFCILGLGTLLIGELPRQPGKELSLISAALLLVGGVGLCCGIVFALVAPLVSTDFQAFSANPGVILLFAAGVGLTAITIVLDEALIGLLRGIIQLGRNALFAAAKLTLLILAGYWLLRVGGEIIYGAWAAGSLLSLVPLAVYVLLKESRRNRAFKPDWHMLRRLRRLALQHHILNLILEAPTMAMPVLVTIVLSATTNAWFYIAWMISGLVFIASYALTTVLYAINAEQRSELTRRLRVTLGLSLLTVSVANCVLLLASTQILDLFGRAYAQQASWCLRILGLAAFPMIVKYHYIAVSRIHSRMARAVLPVAIGGVLELVIAVWGAKLAGLTGFSLGWVMAVCVEAIFMFPAVYRVTFPARASDVQCPQCSVLLPADAHFCGFCGVRLSETQVGEHDTNVAVAATGIAVAATGVAVAATGVAAVVTRKLEWMDLEDQDTRILAGVSLGGMKLGGLRLEDLDTRKLEWVRLEDIDTMPSIAAIRDPDDRKPLEEQDTTKLDEVTLDQSAADDYNSNEVKETSHA